MNIAIDDVKNNEIIESGTISNHFKTIRPINNDDSNEQVHNDFLDKSAPVKSPVVSADYFDESSIKQDPQERIANSQLASPFAETKKMNPVNFEIGSPGDALADLEGVQIDVSTVSTHQKVCSLCSKPGKLILDLPKDQGKNGGDRLNEDDVLIFPCLCGYKVHRYCLKALIISKGEFRCMRCKSNFSLIPQYMDMRPLQRRKELYKTMAILFIDFLFCGGVIVVSLLQKYQNNDVPPLILTIIFWVLGFFAMLTTIYLLYDVKKKYCTRKILDIHVKCKQTENPGNYWNIEREFPMFLAQEKANKNSTLVAMANSLMKNMSATIFEESNQQPLGNSPDFKGLSGFDLTQNQLLRASASQQIKNILSFSLNKANGCPSKNYILDSNPGIMRKTTHAPHSVAQGNKSHIIPPHSYNGKGGVLGEIRKGDQDYSFVISSPNQIANPPPAHGGNIVAINPISRVKFKENNFHHLQKQIQLQKYDPNFVRVQNKIAIRVTSNEEEDLVEEIKEQEEKISIDKNDQPPQITNTEKEQPQDSLSLQPIDENL